MITGFPEDHGSRFGFRFHPFTPVELNPGAPPPSPGRPVRAAAPPCCSSPDPPQGSRIVLCFRLPSGSELLEGDSRLRGWVPVLPSGTDTARSATVTRQDRRVELVPDPLTHDPFTVFQPFNTLSQYKCNHINAEDNL